MSYEEWMEKAQPPWLQNEAGRRWARALGRVLDGAVDGARDAVLARYPSYAPEDALNLVGEGRALRRFPPDEPDDLYRERVRHAWDWWLRAGTKPGMEAELARLGFHARVIEGPFETYFDGAWRFGDYEGAFTGPAWAEFILEVSPAGPWTARERVYLRHAVQELKPAHAVLREVRLLLQDGRVLRLAALPAGEVWDLGRFGEFYFGEVLEGAWAAGLGGAAWLDSRRLEGGVFDGEWSFGERGF